MFYSIFLPSYTDQLTTKKRKAQVATYLFLALVGARDDGAPRLPAVVEQVHEEGKVLEDVEKSTN